MQLPAKSVPGLGSITRDSPDRCSADRESADRSAHGKGQLTTLTDAEELRRRLAVDVQARLGGGASARVYRGTFDDHPAAIKIMHPHAARREDNIGAFLREAHLQARLEHSNIIKMYAVCQLPPAFAGLPTRRFTWGMAMELMEEGPLTSLLLAQAADPGKPLYSDVDAALWCLDVARALEYLHTQKPPVVHRDVKTANILLCRDTDGEPRPHTRGLKAKLADFGLCVVLDNTRPVTGLRRRSSSATSAESVFLHANMVNAMGSYHSNRSVHINRTPQSRRDSSASFTAGGGYGGYGGGPYGGHSPYTPASAAAAAASALHAGDQLGSGSFTSASGAASPWGSGGPGHNRPSRASAGTSPLGLPQQKDGYAADGAVRDSGGPGSTRASGSLATVGRDSGGAGKGASPLRLDLGGGDPAAAAAGWVPPGSPGGRPCSSRRPSGLLLGSAAVQEEGEAEAEAVAELEGGAAGVQPAAGSAAAAAAGALQRAQQQQQQLAEPPQGRSQRVKRLSLRSTSRPNVWAPGSALAAAAGFLLDGRAHSASGGTGGGSSHPRRHSNLSHAVSGNDLGLLRRTGMSRSLTREEEEEEDPPAVLRRRPGSYAAPESGFVPAAFSVANRSSTSAQSVNSANTGRSDAATLAAALQQQLLQLGAREPPPSPSRRSRPSGNRQLPAAASAAGGTPPAAPFSSGSRPPSLLLNAGHSNSHSNSHSRSTPGSPVPGSGSPHPPGSPGHGANRRSQPGQAPAMLSAPSLSPGGSPAAGAAGFPLAPLFPSSPSQASHAATPKRLSSAGRAAAAAAEAAAMAALMRNSDPPGGGSTGGSGIFGAGGHSHGGSGLVGDDTFTTRPSPLRSSSSAAIYSMDRASRDRLMHMAAAYGEHVPFPFGSGSGSRDVPSSPLGPSPRVSRAGREHSARELKSARSWSSSGSGARQQQQQQPLVQQALAQLQQQHMHQHRSPTRSSSGGSAQLQQQQQQADAAAPAAAAARMQAAAPEPWEAQAAAAAAGAATGAAAAAAPAARALREGPQPVAEGCEPGDVDMAEAAADAAAAPPFARPSLPPLAGPTSAGARDEGSARSSAPAPAAASAPAPATAPRRRAHRNVSWSEALDDHAPEAPRGSAGRAAAPAATATAAALAASAVVVPSFARASDASEAASEDAADVAAVTDAAAADAAAASGAPAAAVAAVAAAMWAPRSKRPAQRSVSWTEAQLQQRPHQRSRAFLKLDAEAAAGAGRSQFLMPLSHGHSPLSHSSNDRNDRNSSNGPTSGGGLQGSGSGSGSGQQPPVSGPEPTHKAVTRLRNRPTASHSFSHPKYPVAAAAIAAAAADVAATVTLVGGQLGPRGRRPSQDTFSSSGASSASSSFSRQHPQHLLASGGAGGGTVLPRSPLNPALAAAAAAEGGSPSRRASFRAAPSRSSSRNIVSTSGSNNIVSHTSATLRAGLQNALQQHGGLLEGSLGQRQRSQSGVMRQASSSSLGRQTSGNGGLIRHASGSSVALAAAAAAAGVSSGTGGGGRDSWQVLPQQLAQLLPPGAGGSHSGLNSGPLGGAEAAAGGASSSARRLLLWQASNSLGGGSEAGPSSEWHGWTNAWDETGGLEPVYALTGRMGTGLYMAPEIVKEELYNEKCDVFSFGMVMYEMFARTLLLANRTREELDVLSARMVEGHRPRKPERIDEGAWHIITLCWQQDPVARPSMSQVVQQLVALSQTLIDAAAAPSPAPSTPRTAGTPGSNFTPTGSRSLRMMRALNLTGRSGRLGSAAAGAGSLAGSAAGNDSKKSRATSVVSSRKLSSSGTDTDRGSVPMLGPGGAPGPAAGPLGHGPASTRLLIATSSFRGFGHSGEHSGHNTPASAAAAAAVADVLLEPPPPEPKCMPLCGCSIM